MQDSTSAHAQHPSVPTAPAPSAFASGLDRQRHLRDHIRLLPRRFDLRNLLATIGQVLLWLLFLMEVPLYFDSALSSASGLGKINVAAIYALGLMTFVLAGYGSLYVYRLNFRRALEKSDLNLLIASGSIESIEKPNISSVFDSSDAKEHSLEKLISDVAYKPRRFIQFDGFFFSGAWFALYYVFALAWTAWSMFTINDPVTTSSRMPHAPLIEFFLPIILLARLRRVRLQEVCSYLARMLRD
jgi:hypothetical protein